MLHIISSPDKQILEKCIACCTNDDCVIFIAEAMEAINCSELTPMLQLFKMKINGLYCVEPEVSLSKNHTKNKTDVDDIKLKHGIGQIETINYDTFVELAEKADKVLSWY